MTDPETTLEALKEAVRAFTDARDWAQFHHPKDLGVALACEVGEVLEHFRYRTNEEVRDALAAGSPDHRALAFEMADCLWLLLRLADVCAIDLAASLAGKLVEADRKYPVDRCRGRADKYTAYLDDDPGSAAAPPPPPLG
jgi:dCTP diphosphatase